MNSLPLSHRGSHSFVLQFEIRNYETSGFVIFPQPLGYLESFKVSSKYCDYIFFCKKWHFILIEIAVKLQMTLGSMGILPRLVLLIHERGLFPFICVIPNSSNSYSFEYTYILPPWLSLFLSILLFWCYCEWETTKQRMQWNMCST